MSSEAAASPQDPAHIAVVDVDESKRGDRLQRMITTGSGLETKSSEVTVSVDASAAVVSPAEFEKYNVQEETKVVSEDDDNTKCSSPVSSSSASLPGANTSDNMSHLEQFPASQEDGLTLNNSKDDFIAVIQKDLEPSQNIDRLDMKSVPTGKCSSASSDSVNRHQTYLDINKRLASSTVSLDDAVDTNVTICRSPYSRSADNVSVDRADHSHDNDTEAILSQFKSQKNKVSATQVITTDTPIQANLDVRYTRLPKELLSQDLGSIVKNVHGIFSSVSGSLKNAYTHRAGQIAYMKTVKQMPNGKLMNDIFEDEQSDDKRVGERETPKPEPVSNDVLDETLNENPKLEDGAKGDVLRLQIESLEKVLAEQRKENTALRERVRQQGDELQERDHTFRELETKMDLMCARVERAEREKDAAVMRYAGAECGAIEARRAAAEAARAERRAAAEADLAAAKLRAARDDKERICQLYDDKCHELQNSERELAKVREELKELEGRLKWTQSKLRMEMDAYKESAERVEKLSAQVSELESARDAAAAAAGAEEGRSTRQLEGELTESQAALILCRHERDELERRLALTTQQLETARRERDAAVAAAAAADDEVSRLRAANARLEQEAAELAALRAQAALADALTAQLHRETERAAAAEEALGRERARAETCARREASALEHAARLTAQHVAQRALEQHADGQAQALSADNAALRERVSALEAETARLAAAADAEAERRHRETRVMARKVAELQEEVSRAAERLEWERGENDVLKKKHASALKELNRELSRALKRAEQLEARQPHTQPSTRTGSVTSLSSGESAPPDDRLNGHGHDALPDIQVREPDRQALVERIVALQRAAARRAERCEFLEEHARQLTDELRNKSRLLRHMLPNLPAQALSTTASDSHKKEIAKFGGGAMAALWGGDAGGLSLELSLEMNRRLQSVLEDTLLKNITLKENMDTLGAEIARLKGQPPPPPPPTTTPPPADK